jgi:hypothetical protein
MMPYPTRIGTIKALTLKLLIILIRYSQSD